MVFVQRIAAFSISKWTCIVHTIHLLYRWWQLKYLFMFIPKIGEDEPMLTHIFQIPTSKIPRCPKDHWTWTRCWGCWRPPVATRFEIPMIRVGWMKSTIQLRGTIPRLWVLGGAIWSQGWSISLLIWERFRAPESSKSQGRFGFYVRILDLSLDINCSVSLSKLRRSDRISRAYRDILTQYTDGLLIFSRIKIVPWDEKTIKLTTIWILFCPSIEEWQIQDTPQKTNMSPENQGFEDVFPIQIVPLYM